METLLPASHQQTSFDDRYFYTASDLLPVIGTSAIDQVFSVKTTAGPYKTSFSSHLQEMERMSPDSSMDWNQQQQPIPKGTQVSAEESSPVTSAPQPDSTTNEFIYDSDAFNSEDSNQSFAELSENLLDGLHENDGATSGMAAQSPPPPKVDFANNNFLGKFPPSSPSSSISSAAETTDGCAAQSKDVIIRAKTKKKKSKRAGDIVLQCAQCSYTTRFKEHLSSHMNTHNDRRNHMCSDCGQAFKWSHSLRRHQRKHRSDFAYACAFCSKRFSRKDHLTIHESLHLDSPSDNHRCAECGAVFKNKKTLAGHAKTHAAPRKAFRCGQCEREFTRRASLNRHVRATHAGQTISCPHCPATFSYRSTLEDHKKAAHNQGRREFGCALCGQQFAVKAYLSKHMVTCRNRAAGKSFDCGVCAKSFPTKRHLHEHEKRKHSIRAEEQEIKTEGQQQQQTFVHATDYQQHFPAEQYQVLPPQQHQPLPAFQYQYPHQPQQQQAKVVVATATLCCDLCHAGFSDESSLEAHLLSHFPPTNPASISSAISSPSPSSTSSSSSTVSSTLTGSDLPLPQLQDAGEENVGSLLRLVYNCSEQQQQPVPQQQQQQQQLQEDLYCKMYQDRGPQQQQQTTASLNDYLQLDGFII